MTKRLLFTIVKTQQKIIKIYTVIFDEIEHVVYRWHFIDFKTLPDSLNGSYNQNL